MEEDEDKDVEEEAEVVDEQPSRRSEGTRKASAKQKRPSGKLYSSYTYIICTWDWIYYWYE